MAWHDRNKDGPMCQELITTRIESVMGEPYDVCLMTEMKTHADKVSQFNKDHIVFFTQDTFVDGGVIVTSCLYADKTIKKAPVPPVPTIPIHKNA